jgi:hypothetical protein
LRQVFAANGLMAEHVLGLLLEKADSDAPDAKVDALLTLAHCVSAGNWLVEQLDPFLGATLATLTRELLSGAAGEEVYSAACAALSSLVVRLCPDRVGGFAAFHLAPSWNLFLGPLLAAADSELSTAPDGKAARSWASVLQLVCASSANAFGRTLGRLFRSRIEAKFHAPPPEGNPGAQPSQRLALLELLNLLIGAAAQDWGYALPQHPLQPYVESIMAMQASVLIGGNAEQRATAVQGLAALAAVPPFDLLPQAAPQPAAAAAAAPTASSGAADASAMSDVLEESTDAPEQLRQQRVLSESSVRSVVSTLTSRLLGDEHEVVRSHCLEGLVRLARDAAYTPLVQEITLPVLFSEHTKSLLPLLDAAAEKEGNVATNKEGEEDTQMASSEAASSAPTRQPSLEDVLDAAAALCVAAPLLETVRPHLLDMLQLHFRTVTSAAPGSSSSSAATNSLLALHELLACLVHIVVANASTAEGRARIESSIAPLFHSLVGLLLSGSSTSSPLSSLDGKVVATAVQIVHALARGAPANVQQGLLDATVQLFLDGNVAAFVSATDSQHAVAAVAPFAPFSVSPVAPAAQLQLVPLFTAVVGSHRRDGVQLPRLCEIVQTLLRFIDYVPAAGNESPSVAQPAPLAAAQQSAVECVAALINKLDARSELLTSFLEQLPGRLPRLVELASSASPGSAAAAASAVRTGVSLLLWSAKALLMRGHAGATAIVQQLMEQLLSSAAAASSSSLLVSESIARGMGVLLQDSTTVLNRESHAICGPGVSLSSFRNAAANACVLGEILHF